MKLHKNRTLKIPIPFVFISPFYILFAIFTLYPVIFSLYLSFNKWHGTGLMRWVGFTNYVNLWRDPVFIQTLINSIIIFFENVPVMLFLALILAVLLNSNFIKFKSLFRTIIFIPYITSSVAVSYSFQLLLNKNYGLVNQILGTFNIRPIGWLQSPVLAQLSLSVLVAWQYVGYNMILFLAGLQNIPPELYEAAKMDGSTSIKSFFYITLPLMRPTILFCTILSTVGTVSLFGQPIILTNGGPMNATLTPILYLYNVSFGYFQFGYGSALAYVLFIILFVVSLFELKFIGGNEKEEKVL